MGAEDRGTACLNLERRRKDANKRLVAGVIDKYGRSATRTHGWQNYRRYAHEYPLIGKALRLPMAAEGAPALVHCVNGKTTARACSCATLLRIAGFANEFVVAEAICMRMRATPAKSLKKKYASAQA